MKKILKSAIALFALVAFTNLANAQNNSGTTPAIGTDHNYWVNSDGTTQTSGSGSTYEWYISTEVAGAAYTNADEFTAPTTGYGAATADLFKIGITWKAAAANKTYYLHVIETNAEGCSNHKAQVIKPFSNFQLAIANVTNAFENKDDNYKICAPDVTLTADESNASGVAYNYGTTKLYYKVDATNIGKQNFELGYQIAVAEAYKGNTPKATIGNVAGDKYTNVSDLTVGAEETVTIANAENSNTKYVCIELENGTFEGLAEHMVTVTLKSGKQAAAIAKVVDGKAERVQVVKARPSTSGIGSN